jgi:hypothetical protein
LGEIAVRMIYIASCREIDKMNVAEELLFPFMLAFPENTHITRGLENVDELRKYARRKVDEGERLLYIIDDWNHFERAPLNSLSKTNKVELECLCTRSGETIFGLSAADASISVSPEQIFRMNALTQSEWANCWKQSSPLYLALTGREEEDFLFATGSNPLMLNIISKLSQPTLDERLDALMLLRPDYPFSGLWMYEQLEKFLLRKKREGRRRG